MALRRRPRPPKNPAFRVAYVICRAFHHGRCICAGQRQEPCAAAAQAAEAAAKLFGPDKQGEGA